MKSTVAEAPSTELRVIKDIQDLVESVEMSDVQFYELSAKKNESSDEIDEKEIDPTFLLQIGHPSDGIGVRLAVEVSVSRGIVRADVGVIYATKTKDDHISVPEEIGLEFANRVGVLALIPYLRESVTNMSLRVLGKPINLPLFRAGQLTFQPSDYQSPATAGTKNSKKAKTK